MAPGCISSCMDEVAQPESVHVVRATFTNLYKWPESDAEFLLSVSSANSRHPRVADSISCRQMYLKSYTFSRDDDQADTNLNGIIVEDHQSRAKSRTLKLKGTLHSVLRRLLSCTTKIDVVG